MIEVYYNHLQRLLFPPDLLARCVAADKQRWSCCWRCDSVARRASRMVICRNENLIKHAAEVALNNLTARGKWGRRQGRERGEECQLDEKFPPPSFLLLAAFYVFFFHFIGASCFICVLFFYRCVCCFSFYATFTFLDILLCIFRAGLALVSLFIENPQIYRRQADLALCSQPTNKKMLNLKTSTSLKLSDTRDTLDLRQSF